MTVFLFNIMYLLWDKALSLALAYLLYLLYKGLQLLFCSCDNKQKHLITYNSNK